MYCQWFHHQWIHCQGIYFQWIHCWWIQCQGNPLVIGIAHPPWQWEYCACLCSIRDTARYIKSFVVEVQACPVKDWQMISKFRSELENKTKCHSRPQPGNPYWVGRHSTVDLLVLTNLDQLLFIFVAKQASLMRRSTVPSFPLLLVFPALTFNSSSSSTQLSGVTHTPSHPPPANTVVTSTNKCKSEHYCWTFFIVFHI